MNICCKSAAGQVKSSDASKNGQCEPMDKKGAYLLFDSASNGSLHIQWKNEPVPGALAFIKPGKNVPEFKYKNNGGKSEIIRNLQADKKLFYSGVGQFIKEARDLKGEVYLLPDIDRTSPLKLDVYFLKNNTVHVAKIGTPFSISDASAICIMPRGTSSLSVKTMERQLFIVKGNTEGACIAF